MRRNRAYVLSNSVYSRGWASFRKANATPCAECNHERWHHLGLLEPGCSYAGTCTCPAFRSAMKESA